jgi:hypothetical protein
MIMTTNKVLVALLFSLAAFAAAACSHGGRLETPSGFATLGEDSTFSYRATSARGVVLATRTHDNDVKANTEFWTEALDLKLKDKGYVADGTKSVKTARGLEGTQLRYTTTKNGRAHRYWVTVFATKSKVFLVEAAGDKEPFDKTVHAVEHAIASLDASD